MKVSLGLIPLISGILGIAWGGVDVPNQKWGGMMGAGPGFASLITRAAALLLVGGY